MEWASSRSEGIVSRSRLPDLGHAAAYVSLAAALGAAAYKVNEVANALIRISLAFDRIAAAVTR